MWSNPHEDEYARDESSDGPERQRGTIIFSPETGLTDLPTTTPGRDTRRRNGQSLSPELCPTRGKSHEATPKRLCLIPSPN